MYTHEKSKALGAKEKDAHKSMKPIKMISLHFFVSLVQVTEL